jgi:hypothetical protein
VVLNKKYLSPLCLGSRKYNTPELFLWTSWLMLISLGKGTSICFYTFFFPTPPSSLQATLVHHIQALASALPVLSRPWSFTDPWGHSWEQVAVVTTNAAYES